MRVDLVDGTLVLDFPFDREAVDELKQIEGAKWSKLAKKWIAPMSSFTEVREFARKWRLDLADDLETFEMPERAITYNGLQVANGALTLAFRYDQVKYKALVDTVPGVVFDKKVKVWNVPLESLAEVITWCDRFRVPVPEALRAVNEYQVSRRARLAALSRQKTAEPVLVPGCQAVLDPHQHVAVKYLAQARRGFLADDIGLGKTLETIAALEYTHSEPRPSYPALVICPPKLALNWKKEYEQWLPHRKVAVVATKKQPIPTDVDVVIIGYSIIHDRQAELVGFRSLACDESHAFKNGKAQRTRAAKAIAAGIPEDGIVWNLTGTPITIRPAEYVPQLQIAGLLHHFGGDMGFYRSFCDAKRDKFNKWDFSGASNLEILNERLRGLGYLRRERDEVLTDLLPTAPPIDVLVDLEPKWQKEYDQAEADIVEYLVERARQIAIEMGLPVKSAEVMARMKAEAGKHLVRISVLRKISAMGKLEATFEEVDKRIEVDRKVIIAAHHREVVDALAERYGGLKIQGGMNGKEVEQHKHRFMTLPCSQAPAITLSIQAGKEGHTLTAARDVVFAELAWTSTDIDQTWGRAWRRGQTGKVHVAYLLGANTIDVSMFDMIGLRRTRVRAATQGAPIDSASGIVGALLAKGLAALN